MLAINLLGRFEVRVEGQVVPEGAWTRRDAMDVVKVLAVTPGHTLHQEQVMDALWPQEVQWQARNRLYKALHAARRALEPQIAPRGNSRYVHRSGAFLALRDARIDADEFERTANAAIVGGERGVLEETLSMWHGHLLPADLYADWALQRRRALASLHERVTLAVAERLGAEGALGQAVTLLGERLQDDPTAEHVHRAVMRLYAAAGRREEALGQYRVLVQVLESELGAAPEEMTEALRREIESKLAVDVVAGSAPSTLPPAWESGRTGA